VDGRALFINTPGGIIIGTMEDSMLALTSVGLLGTKLGTGLSLRFRTCG